MYQPTRNSAHRADRRNARPGAFRCAPAVPARRTIDGRAIVAALVLTATSVVALSLLWGAL